MSRYPWFKWFPRDYMTSPKAMALSWEEQGIYRFLLDVQWINDGIPENPSEVCSLVKGAKRKSVEKILSTFFVPHPSREGLLVNRRLFSSVAEKVAVSNVRIDAAKASHESRKSRTNAKQTPCNCTDSEEHLQLSSRARAGAQSREEGEGEGEGEKNTPLPPDSGPGASTEDEGGDVLQEEAEARHHRAYCRKEAKGLPSAFLDDSAFSDAWCDWVAHLKARHHKGFNPPFTTVTRHKEQIRALSLADATWALTEGIRRNLPFPADPSRRPASAAPSSGEPGDFQSVAATPEQLAADADETMRHLRPLPRPIAR